MSSALLVVTSAAVGLGWSSPPPPHAEPSAIQAPELKWEHGGCYSSWCETGWYASPAVADLDGDGTVEVIAGAYTVFILNGEDGTVQRSTDTPGSRVWPGVVAADVDGKGNLEIVTAQGGGYVNVLDHAGDVIWTRRPASNELRGLSVRDLEGDGSMEIVVTGAVYGKTNTWIYEHDGTLRAGWPQLSNDSGYAYGVFNDNAALGDIDGDGASEIIVPSDVHYICVYEPDGTQIAANAMYGGKGWGQVGVWESLDIELRGWGRCNGVREESYRTNFAHGPAVIADLDGDGVTEVAAVGNVYDCHEGHPPGKYHGLYVFNADRTRFDSGDYDWRTVPTDTGAPLSEDWHDIESAQPNPVVADLDGDGEREILFSSYDGRLHAFWLDKSERHNWPYAVYDGSGPYRFASEPTVADLDDNGYAEVIFASWPYKGSFQTGKLHVLDYQGAALHEVDLPTAYGSPDWNGALAAPTLANIDADADLEVVLNTAHSGFVAYDLPDTAGARVLWGTGRGNYQRTGSILHGSLRSSRVSVHPRLVGPGDPLTYTIRLENPGPSLPTAHLTSTLPLEEILVGTPWASSGSTAEAGGAITWTGGVTAGVAVTITYGAVVDGEITEPRALVNSVLIDDGAGNVYHRSIVAIANGVVLHLPVVLR